MNFGEVSNKPNSTQRRRPFDRRQVRWEAAIWNASLTNRSG